ncbi:MAG: chloride channel protein [Phycisphaerales bacterium JB040]
MPKHSIANSLSPRALLRAVVSSSVPKPEWYLVVMGAVIGLFTALGAIGFDRTLRRLEHATALAQADLPLWLLPMIPMAGALVTGLLVYFGAREAGGHGVPQVMDAIIRRAGHIPARIGVVKVLASISTVGSGGSAGTEGPIIQIGSVAGSFLARRLGIPREHVSTMVGCGAAAGISSIFNAPIAGVFFALEVLLRDFSLRTFTPIVIASVFATALTQVVLGANEPIFAFDLPDYHFTLAELPAYVVLGGLCALAAVAFTHTLHASEDLYERLPIHPVLKPVSGALLLGLLGIAFLGALGAEWGPVPAFFGNGYATIGALLEPSGYEGGTGWVAGGTGAAVALLVVLLGCKVAATPCTLASRGSGGVFAPSLFIGACAGSGLGLAMESVGLLPAESSPASYALVGMAAVVAGTTFAPLTAILLLFELTREPLVLAPIMLAAIVSVGVARSLMPDSIYTYRLRMAGLLIGTGRDLTVLRRISVSSVETVALPPEPIYASDPLAKLVTLHANHNIPDFPVVAADGTYLGMVTGADIRSALIDREAIPLLLVAELVRGDLPTVHADETLDTVLDAFARYDVASLCLVDSRTGEPRGLITRSRVLARYRHALEHS